MQPVQASIEQTLTEQFDPVYLTVINESHKHSVPPNSETHFKVTLVSQALSGKRQVQRHQMIYKALTEQMAGPVHALSLHTLAPTSGPSNLYPTRPTVLAVVNTDNTANRVFHLSQVKHKAKTLAVQKASGYNGRDFNRLTVGRC